jgi:DNA-binding MarR family transcriptional regulator
MATSRLSKAALAQEIWRRLFDFFISTRAQRDRVLDRIDLTPNDSKALASLDRQGKAMGTLAAEWGCDASNATWIVDRLEQRGLAERQAVPGDRRVKLVVLTARGMATRSKVMEEFRRPPPQMLELNRRDLEALRNALSRLPSSPEDAPQRRSRKGKRR